MERSAISTVFTCLFLYLGVEAQIDRTREEGAKGSALVEAVLAELHDSCIYPEDSLLLRRIAYVETRDGTDPATYTTSGRNGGIWKVDQAMFQRTQTERNRLTLQYDLIQQKLGIDWSTVTWTDMSKPLYSALAAAMILVLEGAPDYVPISVSGQAAFWLTHYHNGQGSRTTQDFIGPAHTLQKSCARTENMDVVFLMDTSTRVGPAEWTALKKFVGDVIINLSLDNGLGPDKDRVAMVTFGDQARVSFGLTEGVDLVTTMGLINSATYIPGNTNISAALTTAQTQIFKAARPSASKVAVLIADGKDDNRVSVIMAQMPLKLTEVTFFTVGVGHNIDEGQLRQIASDPTCSHFYTVASHQELPDLRVAMERISCRVPVMLSPGQYSYPCGFNVLAQVQGGSLGTSVTISVDYGSIDVYGSYATQLPSADVHDVNHTANDSSPTVLFTRDPRPLALSLRSRSSRGLQCNGNFTVRVDSQAARRTDCNKRKADLVFLLDSTLARTDADWTAMLNFVQTFSQQFDVTSIGAHVALVSFADTQTMHFRLGQHGSTAELLQALRNIARPPGTTSDLPAALTYVNNQVLSNVAMGSRADASKTIILVTPGTVDDPLKTEAQVSMLHSLGVRIVAVAVGNNVDQTNLEAMTSGPQHLQIVSQVTAMTSVVGNVIKEACGAVTVLCVEGGISRDCHIEDIINTQYGHLLGPDRTVSSNPCALQIATGPGSFRLERFPHPTDPDKFLLCDSSGQVYVVLCPSAELYFAAAHECRNPAGGVTTPAGGVTKPAGGMAKPAGGTTKSIGGMTFPAGGIITKPVGGSTFSAVVTTTAAPVQGPFTNPCTPDNIIKGLMFHADPADRTKYYHCGAMPFTGQLDSCPSGQVWDQTITQCVVATGVIVDQTSHRVDPNMHNPCTGGADYFPLAQDPSSYIQCNLNHEAFLKHCSPGQVWDNQQKVCDNP